MTDIILLCDKMRSTTLRAINSILENTTDINLIIVKKEQSVAKNRNVWLNRTLSNPFVMVDDDIVVYSGWLDGLKKAMTKGVGVVGPKIVNSFGKQWDIPQNQTETAKEVYELSGCCCLYKNINILADEKYIESQWEDTDIQWQYKDKGYKLVVNPDVIIEHTAAGNSPGHQQNEKYFISKWGKK